MKKANQPAPTPFGSVWVLAPEQSCVPTKTPDPSGERSPPPSSAISEAAPDAVNHPKHYIEGRKFENWDVLDDWFPNDPLKWNAGKYLCRAGRKGEEVEDLEKAVAYIQRRIRRIKHGN